ncbi:DUF5063 domain-containing protein [Porphyromonadaceae sp. NP-X]|nr:DUF5063 domain-containing protein [Porphyromonadaceae sp. NP-X]
MSVDELPDHIVYSGNVIEFVTVVAETCLFLEHTSEMEKDEFVEKSLKLLPLLYLKASVLDIPEPVYENFPERFVTEEDYQFVREQIEQLLGNDDVYLEVFHPDMAISDTPVAAFISENLSDIYQEIKDFAANYQTADVDIMNDALSQCLTAFGEHWGQKLLNAMRALHALKYNPQDDADWEETHQHEDKQLTRDSFLDFQHNAEDDDLSPFLK